MNKVEVIKTKAELIIKKLSTKHYNIESIDSDVENLSIYIGKISIYSTKEKQEILKIAKQIELAI